MKRIYRGFFLIALCFLSFSSIARAEVFELHFSYDQKKDYLAFDTAESLPITVNKNQSLSIMEFNNPVVEGSFEYTLFDAEGVEMLSVQFTPTQGNFTVQLPYFSIAQTVKVRRLGQQDYFLEKDISSLSSCNTNQVCEFELKENTSTCLSDCANGHTQYSGETEKLLDQGQGAIRDPETGEVLLKREPVIDASQWDVPRGDGSDAGAVSMEEAGSNQNAILLGSALAALVAIIVAGYWWRRHRSQKK